MEHKAYAILIDGGFVRYTLKRKRSNPPIDATVLAAFIESVRGLPALQDASLHRVYFYDARPLTGSVTRPDGVVINFANSLPNCHERAFAGTCSTTACVVQWPAQYVSAMPVLPAHYRWLHHDGRLDRGNRET